MVLTLFKCKILIGKNKEPKSCNTKIQAELSEMVGTKEFGNLINSEVLYWSKADHDDGYAIYAKVLGLSPNGKFVRMVNLNNGSDSPAYYMNIESIEILDILS